MFPFFQPFSKQQGASDKQQTECSKQGRMGLRTVTHSALSSISYIQISRVFAEVIVHLQSRKTKMKTF